MAGLDDGEGFIEVVACNAPLLEFLRYISSTTSLVEKPDNES